MMTTTTSQAKAGGLYWTEAGFYQAWALLSTDASLRSYYLTIAKDARRDQLRAEQAAKGTK